MSAVAVVVGTTEVIGPPAAEPRVGTRRFETLELGPSDPVEDEQDDLIRFARRLRKPVGMRADRPEPSETTLDGGPG